MAEIIKSFIPFAEIGAELLFTPVSGSDYFIVDNADQRLTLVVRNTNTQNATVTLAAGDGSLAPLGGSSFEVDGGKTFALPLSRVDSARIKVFGGADRGKAFVTSSVDAGGTLANLAIGIISVE